MKKNQLHNEPESGLSLSVQKFCLKIPSKTLSEFLKVAFLCLSSLVAGGMLVGENFPPHSVSPKSSVVQTLDTYKPSPRAVQQAEQP
jgi:hypothetical protein